MNKKIKIFIVIIIIVILLIAIILGINELSKYHTYVVTIKEIGENFILVEDKDDLIPYKLVEGYYEENEDAYGSKVIIDGETYVVNRYIIYTNDVKIVDENGKKINLSDLQLEDTLKVITKDGFSDAFSNHTLKNVKSIKVLERN